MGITDAVAANEAEQARLVALSERLTNTDRLGSLGDGWTVAVALAP